MDRIKVDLGVHSAPKRIGILLYAGVEPMDYQGPCGIFDLWNLEAHGPEIITIASDGQQIKCAYGRNLVPQYHFSDCPSFDALLVPGGRGRHQVKNDPVFMNFLRERGSWCKYLLSVCTGTFLLAEAGLISGRRVTTHWEFIDELKRDVRFKVQGNERYVHDGHVWTAAGIFSGIDLALAFINSFEGTLKSDGSIRCGEAGKIQAIAQYFPLSVRYKPVSELICVVPDFIRSEFV